MYKLKPRPAGNEASNEQPKALGFGIWGSLCGSTGQCAGGATDTTGIVQVTAVKVISAKVRGQRACNACTLGAPGIVEMVITRCKWCFDAAPLGQFAIQGPRNCALLRPELFTETLLHVQKSIIERLSTVSYGFID